MIRCSTLATAAVLTVLAATPALADVRATVLLTSGARLTVDVVDLNASGLVVRERGRERAIPVNDVALIDFEGSATNLPDRETRRAGGGIVVLRSGEVIDARISDIGGSAPLRITLDARGGSRDVTSDEVARIYLREGPWGGGESTPAPPAAGQNQIRVEGNRQWTPTGISVRRGQRVFISAEGQVRLSGDPGDVATPYGSTNQRYAPRAPLPRELAGALIGRIGDRGRPFGLGNPNGEVPMPEDGQLWLGINDDALGDNSGAFTVTVRGGAPIPGPRRR
jgi:hypothetical protein